MRFLGLAFAFVCAVLLLDVTASFAHPPAGVSAAPSLPIPPRSAYPQTREAVTLPERPGRQLYVDDPIVEDVFIQSRVRQRVTYLPTQYEQVVDEMPAMPMPRGYYAEPMPRGYYAEPMPAYGYSRYASTGMYVTAPKYYVAEPAGAYTKARYGPFGRLREMETTGDPARVPRSTPGPVRTFIFGQ